MARLLAGWPLALETEAGRVYVTTDRAVAAGQLLLDAPSYAVAISADWLERVCVGCAKVGYAPFRLRCETCRGAHFCSSACRDGAGRERHAPVCGWEAAVTNKLRAADVELPPTATEDARVRLALAALLTRAAAAKEGGAGRSVERGAPTFRDVLAQACGGEASASPRAAELAAVAHAALSSLLPTDATETDVAALLARAACNAFPLSHGLHDRHVGVVLCPAVALLNHSCDPNAAIVAGTGFRVQVRALRALEWGEEVLVCRTALHARLADRTAELRERYGLDCACARCVAEADGEAQLPEAAHECGGALYPVASRRFGCFGFGGGEGALRCSVCCRTLPPPGRAAPLACLPPVRTPREPSSATENGLSTSTHAAASIARLSERSESPAPSASASDAAPAQALDAGRALLLARFAMQAYGECAAVAGGVRDADEHGGATLAAPGFAAECYAGVLDIELRDALGLPAADAGGACDAYCVLSLLPGDAAHTSGICRGTLAPKWRERVRLPVRDAAAGELRVRLVDADPLRPYGGALGGAAIPLLQLCDGARHAMQLRLRGPGGGGMLRVALRFTPHAQPAAAPAGPEDASDSEADEEPPLPPAAAFEAVCEVTHAGTSTQATLWRASAARVLVLAFRGTQELRDWLTDLECVHMRAGEENEPHAGKVHAGFMRAYDSVRRRVLTALVDARRVAPGQTWRVVLTGHSMGGALATLCAAELAEMHAGSTSSGKGGGADVRVSLCTFGSPRVGDAAFAARCDAFLGAASVRVVNHEDIVPLVPPLGFRHVGSAVRLAGAAASPLALPDAKDVFAALLRGTAIDNHYVEHYIESLERVIVAQGGNIGRPAQEEEEEEHASETSSDALGEQL